MCDNMRICVFIWSWTHGDFVLPRTRLAAGLRTLLVGGPRLWNRLPTDLKTLIKTVTFKRELKNFLFTQAYDL